MFLLLFLNAYKSIYSLFCYTISPPQKGKHQHNFTLKHEPPPYKSNRHISTCVLACVASVSVQFRNKERGTRVKDRTKHGTSKGARFFGSCFISRAVKTENPIPRSFFAPKPNGNACYAGYMCLGNKTQLNLLYVH